MFLHSEDVAAVGLRVRQSYLRWLDLPAGKVMVKRSIAICGCNIAGFVVGNMLYSLPHRACVFTVKAVVNNFFICSLSNASLQHCSGSTKKLPVTRPECCVSLPKQALHFSSNPRFSVGKTPQWHCLCSVWFRLGQLLHTAVGPDVQKLPSPSPQSSPPCYLFL